MAPLKGDFTTTGEVFSLQEGVEILPVALLEGRILPQNGHALAPKYLRGDIDDGRFGPFENAATRDNNNCEREKSMQLLLCLLSVACIRRIVSSI